VALAEKKAVNLKKKYDNKYNGHAIDKNNTFE